MGKKRSSIIKRVKVELISAFLIADMGPISFYLDLKIEQNREKKIIKLFQLAYIDKILTKFHLDKANWSNISMKKSVII